jgi:peptidylprolyl isomerase
MTNTTNITDGSNVTLHYKGTLGDGTEFDSSYSRNEPITVTVGSGQLIAGFETNLQGLTEGDTKTFTLEPSEAYGDHDPNATTTLERSVFPDDFTFTEGMTVPLTGPNGQNFLATISEITDTNVTADLNHPMAGKDLTFEVEVLTVENNEETVSG